MDVLINKSYNFITLIITIWIVIFSGNNIFAQQIEFNSINAKVGMRPIAIIPNKVEGTFKENPDTLNVICLGLDINGNNHFDNGDELPSWWKIEGVINANPTHTIPQPVTIRKVMDLDFYSKALSPFRITLFDSLDAVPALHGNYLSLPSKNTMNFYNTSTGASVGHTLYDSNITTIGSYGRVVVTGHKVYQNEDVINTSYIKGWKIHGWNRANNFEIELKNKIVHQVIPYSYINEVGTTKEVVVTVCEQEESGWTLEFYEAINTLVNTKYKYNEQEDIDNYFVHYVTQISLGKVSDMQLLHYVDASLNSNFPIIFCVASEENKVKLFNGKSYDNKLPTDIFQYKEFNFPITEPGIVLREISIVKRQDIDHIMYSGFISASNGKIYLLEDISHSNVVVELDATDVPEGVVAIFNNGIAGAYTNLYKNGTNEANNEVTILYMNNTYIESDVQADNLMVYPNPANNTLNIKLNFVSTNNIKNIVLLDINGNIITEIKNISTKESVIQLKLSSQLAIGTYFIRLNINNEIITKSIIIG